MFRLLLTITLWCSLFEVYTAEDVNDVYTVDEPNSKGAEYHNLRDLAITSTKRYSIIKNEAELNVDGNDKFKDNLFTTVRQIARSPFFDRLKRHGSFSEPPENVIIVPLSPTSLEITWDPPASELSNGEITGYKLRWKELHERRSNTVNIEGGLRSFIVEDLEQDTAYKLRMAAMTLSGTGPFTDWMEGRTLKDVVASEHSNLISPPVVIRSIVLSQSAIHLEWNDTFLNQEQGITSVRLYTIQYEARYPYAELIYVETADLELIIRGLAPGTLYRFAVRVSIGEQTSAWSLSVFIKTFEAPPGSPPSLLAISPLENNPSSVSLYWMPPSYPNGIIIGYLIYFTTDNTQQDHNWVINAYIGSSQTAVIEHLTVDTTYYFKIQARNAEGVSPLSDILTFRTPPASEESPPRTLMVVPVEGNPSAIDLNWQSPRPTNGRLIGYLIYYATDPMDCTCDWVILPHNGNSLTATVDDLAADTIYNVKIQAMYEDRVSPLSDIVEYRTP
ncbi:neogenin-like [Glandiceps talaboti]